ncbi:hypothetical protein FDZ71_01020 [bacterium]|nr:MAG: hypothetical protein FDZ71_01020 [bacterium]
MATSGFSSRADAAKTLRGVEKALYELVGDKGKVRSREAEKILGLSEEEIKRAFSVLRHMELLRAAKNPSGGVDLIPF